MKSPSLQASRGAAAQPALSQPAVAQPAGLESPAAGPDRFPICVALTLEWEGGNDDDPRDPGGRTSRGIIQREWDVWRQTHPGLPSDVWEAPQSQVLAIYREKYWDALSCGQLPPGVDFCVFDYGVNSGNSRSAKALQQLVGTATDGEIGPLTIAAAAKADAASLVNKICDQRLAFLRGLSTWSVFGRGWTNRVEGVRRAARGMAGPAALAALAATDAPAWLVKARGFEGFTWASGAAPAQMQSWLKLIKTTSPNIPGLAQYCDGLAAEGGYWPWCGAFVAAMLAGAGLPPVFTSAADTDRFAWAPAWDAYGTKVDIKNGESPRPGDIMRFAWHGGGEHVTFYDHPVESDDLYHCLGGNQGRSHVVSIEGMPMNCIVAVRRPPAAVA
jgi:lysozyme family protein